MVALYSAIAGALETSCSRHNTILVHHEQTGKLPPVVRNPIFADGSHPRYNPPGGKRQPCACSSPASCRAHVRIASSRIRPIARPSPRRPELRPGGRDRRPQRDHPNAVDYQDEQARATLLDLIEMASQATWWWPMRRGPAWAPPSKCGGVSGRVPVVTISPMDANWVIRFLSAAVLPDLAAFREWVIGEG